MPIGYNTAAEAIWLFQLHEAVNIARANGIAERMDQLTANMEAIQALLSRLSIDGVDKDGEDREVDYSQDPEMVQLIDLVRQIGETEQVASAEKIVLIKDGVYGWSAKSRHQLEDRLHDFINRVLTPKMSQTTTEMTQNQHESNTITEIISNALKEQNNLITRINQRNTR